MIWPGALQKKATLSRLEPHRRDVRAVTVYTHMFVLGEPGGRADEREHLHYTATGATPQEAEAAAYAVYQQAVACTHDLVQVSPELKRCRHCGVQQRTERATLPPQPSAKSRRLFGFLRGS